MWKFYENKLFILGKSQLQKFINILEEYFKAIQNTYLHNVNISLEYYLLSNTRIY